ncbi:MAG: hypothetical protein A3C50_02925 [Candidatus Staskawiczbacteria bacterium RIFCSPHIGHO2_02_FULL_43_16]|uniref:Uncharacterized protein n=1 Tax=Candidatus Staskawiczbacteria bacterium RIFCSPHIGHO2_01_FULL_41_41 TaxID=1802203 RepID=A0A1G2HRP4_9BACT|nr:MAG: hypothetical protein A2822_01170 [Candidatus Staskawiczbacteria bacterium RIFCSPHIGHO2_01_FULL_41_41]OGZ68568.1 MAG: hypothetical protein A3C50_02925 [Candidatus Staskawiczbacteria bacterium RIFCSPHIGHO2_02_FULL_43_16]
MSDSLYEGLWISPNFIVERFNEIIQQCGSDFAIKSVKCKHEREAWVGALFALGQRRISQYQYHYHVEIETEQETPDVYVSYLEVTNKGNQRLIANIEVTDWVENSQGDLMEIINKKINKRYPNHFFLVVYVRWPGKAINFDYLYDEISKQKVPFQEIWILLAYADHDYQVTQVYPRKGLIRFNLQEELEKNKNQNYFSRFLKRDTGTEWVNLGKPPVIPLPDCKNKLDV